MANEKITPVEAFEIASGFSALELRTLFAICFISGLLFAYVWAIKKGYSGLFAGFKGNIFEYFKLVLKGAAIVFIVIMFFVY